MATILVLMTKSATLGLLDGRRHESGFWAEEFVVPYERFRADGYRVEVATVGGAVPKADPDSLSAAVVRYTRPAGSSGDPERDVAHYRTVLDSATELRDPRDVAGIASDDLGGDAGVFVCRGGGGLGDAPPHPGEVRRGVRGARFRPAPVPGGPRPAARLRPCGPTPT